MRFLIVHGTVTSHDAIGNDIEIEYRILNEKYETKVYAVNRFNANVLYLDDVELEHWLTDKECVLIYHHSVFWKDGYEMLKKHQGKKIVKYHNITPEEFFEPYYEDAYIQCKAGREQTLCMQKEMPELFWICDSKYNAKDLELVPAERIGIAAPFNKLEEWKQNTIPDEEVLKTLLHAEEKLNVLFVGRIAPNKGHKMLFKVIDDYCAYYGRSIKLRIIGKFDGGLSKYNDELTALIKKYGLEERVEFIGEINDATLMAYYLGSDVMLCCSEHEGFCVPITEAQFLGLPIIALDECAVPETIGVNQLVIENDSKLFAAALHCLSESNEMKRKLVQCGYDNYQHRFTYDSIKEAFLECIERGIA